MMTSAREKAKWALFSWQSPQDLARLARLSGVPQETLELWMNQLESQAYQLFQDDPTGADSALLDSSPMRLPELALIDQVQDQYESIGGPIITKKASVAIRFEQGLSKTPATLTYQDSAIDYSGLIYTTELAFLYQQRGYYYLLIESIEVGQGHTKRQFVKQFRALSEVSLMDMHWKEVSPPQKRPIVLDTKAQFTEIKI